MYLIYMRIVRVVTIWVCGNINISLCTMFNKCSWKYPSIAREIQNSTIPVALNVNNLIPINFLHHGVIENIKFWIQ